MDSDLVPSRFLLFLAALVAAAALALHAAGCAPLPPPSGADFDWRERDYERRQYWWRGDRCDPPDRGYNRCDGPRRRR